MVFLLVAHFCSKSLKSRRGKCVLTTQRYGGIENVPIIFLENLTGEPFQRLFQKDFYTSKSIRTVLTYCFNMLSSKNALPLES